MREIAVAGRRSGSRIGPPLQAEALAYFGRMATPPSSTYQDAVNWAIWRWKAIGVWNLILGFWLLCAETSQAALLSVIGDAPHDAVILGTAPTFTALKGYSGFDTAKQVKFPITAGDLGSDSLMSFMAGRVDASAAANTTFIDCDDGASILIPGTFRASVNKWCCPSVLQSGGMPIGACFAEAPVVGGQHGLALVLPGSYGNAGGTLGVRSSNYKTAAISVATHPLKRLCAYGFIDASVTGDQARKFLAVLAELLDQLGALD